jgi:hypothetical protein
MSSSHDAEAGRRLAFEMLGGAALHEPSPEELLEQGTITIEEYRQRIASAGGGGATVPSAAPKLTSARSHGSNPPQRVATPARRSSFNFEELPEDVVVLDARQQQREQQGALRPMAMTMGTNDVEVARLRKAEAELAEQLEYVRRLQPNAPDPRPYELSLTAPRHLEHSAAPEFLVYPLLLSPACRGALNVLAVLLAPRSPAPPAVPRSLCCRRC